MWHLFVGGDLNAFSALFKEYYPLFHNYGFKICGNRTFTEDCLQDFFIYLYENRENLGEVNSVRAYLFISFRRAMFKAIKKERVFTDFDEYVDSLSRFEFSVEEIAIEQEFMAIQTKMVAKILNNLSKREREVIYLKYYSGLRTKEISEVMDISYQSVLNTLQKAFVKLRKTVESEAIRNILRG
ncbi:RNA polymerase sigma factor [Spongiimicrobium sp. 3-5]|uniref:RNA polymerase sigma factor n=1 Tax=Spongiimicrobium sp. 3-5 TaxID=3332596 RepID=UPI0039812E32